GIFQRASELLERGDGAMKYKRWVRAEVVIIKQCAGSMTVERIGQLIGRTGAAVRTKSARAENLYVSAGVIITSQQNTARRISSWQGNYISRVLIARISQKNSKCRSER
ncbi:hypothetical protein SJH87_13290, partial [Staphylococcus sp. GCP4]|nr:hypothetical protein [Staphylococcus sp. GCP4]